MAKASWPVEFKLDSYLEGYQRYGAIHRLNFLLHQLQPPASEVEATRERLFHLVKSIYGTQYLQHHYSQYPEEAVVHLPWASEIQEVRSKLYTTLDESLQRAREHRDKGQIFVMQDQIGNFLLEKGAFEMALSVFQKNTNEWSTLEERLLVFIQCIRCHFANEAYDQAGELAVRALELIPSSSSSSSSSSSASIVSSSSSSSSTGPSSSSSIYEDQMNCFLAAAGIAAFRTRQYSTAVSYFLRISPSIGHVYGDFIVDRDVLVYGCLCALATFSRDELASRLLQNQTFSGLFSLSPAILAIVLDFYDGKFSEGLTKLAAFFQQAGADYHLMGVAGNLNKTIRETALIRYIQPFSHVNLTKMAAVFHSPLDTLHHELNTLILSRRLSGMIDSHQNIYVAKTVDTRTAMFNTALSTVDTFLSEAEATFYRMNLQLAFSPHHL